MRTTDMAHFELVENMAPNAIIKVIGVGGGGGNAVAHMVSSSVEGVEFVTANTDSQAIKNCGAKLQLQLGGNATMIQAFRAANDVLLGAVQGIADLIVRPGLINVDFADVRTVMSEMGLAMMGTGNARGDDRAQAAAEAAIQNPLD